MALPLISCICPTYNRPPSHQHLIEEAIESFLRQDYPNKELLILNDTPGQELHCDAPGVVIANVDKRFPTLGEKCNAAVGMSQGYLIAPWDDDDISLPWRLSLSVEKLGDGDYFNPRNYICTYDGQIRFDLGGGYAHNASLFRRSAFEQVGGYRPISNGYDRDIDTAFLQQLPNAYDPMHLGSPVLSNEELFYIYRWGVSNAHVSANSYDDDGNYQGIGDIPIVAAWFRLEPHWELDYAGEVRQALDARTRTPLETGRRFRIRR